MPADLSPGKPVRKLLLLRAMRALWKLLSDSSYRSVARLSLLRRGTAFQTANVTRANRYPEIFAFVRSQLGADFAGRILSFGCSTGEELVSLRVYFPRAFIKGIDINPQNIAVCRRRLARMPDSNIAVECAASTAAEEDASYDAIFCMAVLRDGMLAAGNVLDCSRHFPFSRFAGAVSEFALCLKPGGLLIVRHSNFRLCDAPAGAAFEAIMREPHANRHGPPIFGPDNRRMFGVVYEDAVFRKTPRSG